MDTTSVFAPIMKSTEQDDGSLLVYGKVSDDGLDLDGQRCDKSWLSEAIPAWFGTGTGVGGNIRAQHRSDSAIGKAIEHEEAPDGHYVTARIVDREAILKTKAGVYAGFSVGIKNPKIVKSPSAPNGLLTGGSVIEVSLVDRPANPSCLITLCKAATPGMEINAADFDEDRGLVRCEELVEKSADVDAKESDVPTLAETLAPEQLEKLAAAVESPEDLVDTGETPTVEKAVDDTPAEVAPAGGGSDGNAPAFDVDAAKALVDKVLAKAEGDEFDATDFAPMAPPSDETVASVAISLIAGLIQSEAQGMVDNPGEDLDIKCLLNAVDALRWFIRRERQEGDAGGESDSAPYAYSELAATPDAEKTAEIVNVNPDPSPELVEAIEKATNAAGVVERNELGDFAPAGAVTRTAADVEKPATVPTADVPAVVAAKTATPETTKAATVDTDGDALVKALSAALEKADSPLRAAFQNIVTSSTETTAKAVDELTARLVKVENMAVPGGPALRRTEVERTSARRTDLVGELLRFQAKAASAVDVDLRKGYAAKVAELEAEIRSITA